MLLSQARKSNTRDEAPRGGESSVFRATNMHEPKQNTNLVDL